MTNIFTLDLKTADISICFGSNWIKFDVWINRCTFVNLGRPKFQLSSAHEKFGRRWIVLDHKYGCLDVLWVRSINYETWELKSGHSDLSGTVPGPML